VGAILLRYCDSFKKNKKELTKRSRSHTKTYQSFLTRYVHLPSADAENLNISKPAMQLVTLASVYKDKLLVVPVSEGHVITCHT